MEKESIGNMLVGIAGLAAAFGVGHHSGRASGYAQGLRDGYKDNRKTCYEVLKLAGTIDEDDEDDEPVRHRRSGRS